MPERRCEEQSTLALAAVVAINRVYDAKNALDAAKEKKIDTELTNKRFTMPKQQQSVRLLRWKITRGHTSAGASDYRDQLLVVR